MPNPPYVCYTCSMSKDPNKLLLTLTPSLLELAKEVKEDYGISKSDLARLGMVLAHQDITRKKPSTTSMKFLAAAKSEEKQEYKSTIRMSSNTKSLIESISNELDCSQSQAIRLALIMLGKQLNLK